MGQDEKTAADDKENQDLIASDAAGKQPAAEEHVEITDELDAELEKLLQTPPLEGLTDAQVNERIEKFGRNEIPEKKTNPILKFLFYFTGSIAFLIIFAAIISGAVGEYIEFGILVAILIINACIGYFEEAKAENALDALKGNLALKTRVWRNSEMVEVDSSFLVPGDVVAIRLGDIIPADCRGEETEGTLQIDQSALTGESLPVAKGKNAIAYSSSICKQGQMLAVVTKTGINTYIGRAANLISNTKDAGHFQKIINNIGNFLVVITLGMAIILLLVLTVGRSEAFLEALKTVVVLTIAAIPIGMPTVMSVTMALGAGELAKKQVIVKRLTAIEELASVSILCSDKTGTLTMNQLSFDKPYTANKGSSAEDMKGTGERYTEDEIMLISYFSSEPGAHDPIEAAVRKHAEQTVEVLKTRQSVSKSKIPGFNVDKFNPFNPTAKFTEAIVTDMSTEKQFRCIKGAPQVIVKMCGGHSEGTEAVIDLASKGLRALGVARTFDDAMEKFELVGMISLLDPPRPDSGETIRECQELGVEVKMITGDQAIIGREVARRLGMGRTILDATKLVDPNVDIAQLTERVKKADGFAQVIPEHKYKVVELLQDAGILVGMTGDGVNDAPALKKANVGIAVEGCTDAARAASDIVLLASGLSTIVDGIKTSRAIFQRMRSYALYRIASTIHFLLFFFFSILFYDFTLASRLVLLIAVLNDAATLVIAADNARINKRPDKWRIGQLLFISFVLGVLLCVISYLHFYVGKYVIPFETEEQLETMMYLQISSSPHFVIFSTRLVDPFWTNMPSVTFIVAIVGTQIVALLMSVYGVEFFKAYPIGWAWGISVLSISLVTFMLLDFVKVAIYKYWNFELTAILWPSKFRRDQVKLRRGRKIIHARIQKNIDKIRRQAKVIFAVRAFETRLGLGSGTTADMKLEGEKTADIEAKK